MTDAARGSRILFVDQSGELGGAELALLPLAIRHREHGAVVLLQDGPFRERLEAAGVTVHLLVDAGVSRVRKTGGLSALLRAALPVYRQVRALARLARDYDVMFVNTQKAFVLGTLTRAIVRRPVVWFLHDIMSAAHFGALQRYVVRGLARFADATLVNSQAVAQALADLTGRRDRAVDVVYNGIDPSQFDAALHTQHRAIRAALGVPTDAWCIGLFSRLAQWKGQHVLIDAVAQMLVDEHDALERRHVGGARERGAPAARSTRHVEVHVVFVGAPLFGEDAYAARLREQVARLGLEPRIHFAGFQHDVAAWMAAMDVVVHTSTAPEPFGRVVVEGMLAGKPVVAARAGGVMEIVEHGKTGLLTEPGDARALASALGALRRDPAYAAELAEAGRETARRQFTEAAFVERVDAALARVADRIGTGHQAVPGQV
ncbi:glycosyltransferase [Pararobbsia silviterrae]|uniref:Glycosyltransferase family 1 protein n=1 Tax=Pararobbsia silviterrae TaxID=1792498 RepID=A0A494X6Q1_9BURK|nr:glycosyltransferase [Pararobbsia silviterrae]RKP45311.1 glycosyltransferase family 1 protein [Pararobbsia silviterrae]